VVVDMNNSLLGARSLSPRSFSGELGDFCSEQGTGLGHLRQGGSLNGGFNMSAVRSAMPLRPRPGSPNAKDRQLGP
ncbi:unnamed protein product, partial [Polarella glacialis]